MQRKKGISMAYSDKLKDPRWQKKRLEILNRDKFTCCACGDKETELHVHHRSYKKGLEPWDYQDDNFLTYCRVCHSIVEFLKREDVYTDTIYKSGDGFYVALYDNLDIPMACIFRRDPDGITYLISVGEFFIKSLLDVLEGYKNKIATMSPVMAVGK